MNAYTVATVRLVVQVCRLADRGGNTIPLEEAAAVLGSVDAAALARMAWREAGRLDPAYLPCGHHLEAVRFGVPTGCFECMPHHQHQATPQVPTGPLAPLPPLEVGVVDVRGGGGGAVGAGPAGDGSGDAVGGPGPAPAPRGEP